MIRKAFNNWWNWYWVIEGASSLVKDTAFIAYVDGYYLKNQEKHYSQVLGDLTKDAWVAGREYLICHEIQPV